MRKTARMNKVAFILTALVVIIATDLTTCEDLVPKERVEYMAVNGTAGNDDTCLPDNVNVGDLESVQITVSQKTVTSTNYHTNEPEIFTTVKTVNKKMDGLSNLDGLKTRFHGDNICFSYVEPKETEGSPTTYTCHKECMTNTAGYASIETYTGTGGRPESTDPFCCFWGRTVTLILRTATPPTTPPPTYMCPRCVSDCVMEKCKPGDKCYTITSQMKKGDELSILKGCQSELKYWVDGMYCDSGCKYNRRMDSSGPRRYMICVSCCTGDNCNSAPPRHSSSRSLLILAVILITLFNYLK